MNNFKNKVLDVVQKIPKGSVMTYSEVAKMADSPKAYRAVANIMKRNFNKDVPCHRVICANGTIGGYNRGGETEKRRLLKQEGYLK